ncbi:AAA family ATPase [Flexivirga alba]|uniref:AAA family ATPase n=1 Tax=Flexivirga alba TaxID=702742 RepID=A0ABW2AFQ0_9MICO
MLVGRVAERQLIDQLVAGARIGNSGVLAITGEAGVGKTALLDYARSRFDGFQVLSGTGTEPEREIPFAGLLSLLRPVLTRLDSIPGPQAEALSAALALQAGTPGDRFAIGAATLSLLCRCAEEIPVAVVVDDLQWLDRPSAEAVAFAARRLSADPVAVLLAARTGESDDVTTGLPHLSMAGLEIGPAGDLVRSLTALPVTDEQLARLHQLTGGNPLAMLELGGDPALLAQTGPEVPQPCRSPSWRHTARGSAPSTRRPGHHC